MFRPFFKTYDDTIFEHTADVERGLWGLTGPQGFGKSVFLHCLALKRAFGDGNTLVVWVPACPRTMCDVNLSLADGFYRGCRARELDNIPYIMTSNTVRVSLHKMKAFAEKNGKTLLIIIDQMHRKLECFDSLKECLQDYVLTFRARGHRVLLSASTSGTATPIFGEECRDLPPLDNFLSAPEIELVKGKHPNSDNLDLLANSEWSFLNATIILLGTATSLDIMASDFYESLVRQFESDNVAMAISRKVEYARVLHMIIAKEVSQTELWFDPALVDGDKFFVKKQDDKTYVIREFMQGFAQRVLDKLVRVPRSLT
jgi:hypothetical protein